ncbi:hypothetical protein BDV95DRAFT_507562 [Massariosphaeria phaeospora]|uniref:RRM domain-containing protein n=1 Tax=Massariosphaeria phaeospora TaxID=100035 RepID=A0A7C8I193_9PLEO|nr:hypothetical protein BDV95DRAFT_507562 [Massariosphaeria phaeospora]
MSDTKDALSAEEARRAHKTAKRDKKEKREKSKSSKVEAVEQEAEDPKSATKKRKREALPDEIEIDVQLPEPASKKAARKAKKAKTTPTSSTTASGAEASAAKPALDDEDNKAGKRSEFGVWIGNLPWSATKDTLRNFIIDNADMKDSEITRLHMPAPTRPPPANWTTKPLNQGFAYVDFATELAMYSAIALTEQKLDRRPLLIKNARNFEGRPQKAKTEEETKNGKAAVEGKPPNKRIFVGNLAFDVTKDDLTTHFEQCGPVAMLHMATFEDTGKCKGYAWVTYEDIESATSAVKGFIFKDDGPRKDSDKAGSDSDSAPKKKSKKKKWLVNRLFGRDLRCEFAEDSTVRYQKRYGKDKEAEGVHPDRVSNFAGDKKDKRERPAFEKKPYQNSRGKVDPRTIKAGAAHMNAPRASHAIVESKGKKTTFA